MTSESKNGENITDNPGFSDTNRKGTKCCFGKTDRYSITLSESQHPFPFTDLPPEMEQSEEQIIFD